MAAQSCACSTDANAEKELSFFRDKTNPFDTDIPWWINFQEIQMQTRRNCDSNWLLWMGHCDQQSYWFLKLTPLLHISLVIQRSSPVVVVLKMSVASWLGWVRTASSDTSFISYLLWGAFRMSLITQEMKIAKKKSKSTKLSVQQTTDGEQPTKSSTNQHRVHEVICNALLVK